MPAARHIPFFARHILSEVAVPKTGCSRILPLCSNPVNACTGMRLQTRKTDHPPARSFGEDRGELVSRLERVGKHSGALTRGLVVLTACAVSVFQDSPQEQKVLGAAKHEGVPSRLRSLRKERSHPSAAAKAGQSLHGLLSAVLEGEDEC